MEALGFVLFFWGIGLWTLLIWAAVAMARSRGRDPAGWGILTFFYGIFALVALALMPAQER